MSNRRIFRVIGLAALLTLNSAHAEIVRFEFSGILEHSIGGSYYDFYEPPIVEQGAAYSGSWTVNTGLAGETYHGPCCLPMSGKQYSASAIRFQLGPFILNAASPEFVTITSQVVSNLPQIWPSGYSSDYGVFGALSQNDFLHGYAYSIQFFFSYDGNDYWNSSFDQPGNADFFSAMDVGGVVYIKGTTFAELLLPIRNLSSTVIPVPGMWPMFLFAVAVVRRQKRLYV